MKKSIIFVISALSFIYLVTAWEKGDPIELREVLIAFVFSFIVTPFVLLCLIQAIKELIQEYKKIIHNI